MATREERTTAYRRVVSDLIAAATMDGYMERVGIAKAMDALGSIISDTDPHLVHMAIAFRNGPLLGDHQPVNIYLQRDRGPVTWSFEWEEVMGWEHTDGSLWGRLIHTAHVRAQAAGYLQGWDATWCGRVHDTVSCGRFTVTLYPSCEIPEFDDVIGEAGPKPKGTPPGLLPTILIEYRYLLGAVDCSETVELTIINYASRALRLNKPDEFAKLTDSWWAEVEVTDIGYLVTFHYDRELP